MTNENTHLGQRLTLASVVSSDGGRTWGRYRELLTIPPNPAGERSFGSSRVCYPSIFFDHGLCYIGYWAGAKPKSQSLDQQYIAVLPVDWFYALDERHRPETVRIRGQAELIF